MTWPKDTGMYPAKTRPVPDRNCPPTEREAEAEFNERLRMEVLTYIGQ